jgi:hypothetical protein
MGREIRRVPPDWEHPEDNEGQLRPCFDKVYEEAKSEWDANNELWEKGQHPDQSKDWKPGPGMSFIDWAGGSPDPEYYRHRRWTNEEATAYQVYENVSEGTPISPVLKTREELKRWLMEDGSGMGIGGDVEKLTEEAAERFIDTSYSFSLICTSGGAVSSGLDVFSIKKK